MSRSHRLWWEASNRLPRATERDCRLASLHLFPSSEIGDRTAFHSLSRFHLPMETLFELALFYIAVLNPAT
jgi:hypothetical protein